MNDMHAEAESIRALSDEQLVEMARTAKHSLGRGGALVALAPGSERITERQSEVLAFIADHLTTKGYPPTLREIGRHMGIRSTNGVNDHLRALERKGYISREDMQSRAIRVIASPPREQQEACRD